jgi:hypothetical protein
MKEVALRVCLRTSLRLVHSWSEDQESDNDTKQKRCIELINILTLRLVPLLQTSSTLSSSSFGASDWKRQVTQAMRSVRRAALDLFSFVSDTERDKDGSNAFQLPLWLSVGEAQEFLELVRSTDVLLHIQELDVSLVAPTSAVVQEISSSELPTPNVTLQRKFFEIVTDNNNSRIAIVTRRVLPNWEEWVESLLFVAEGCLTSENDVDSIGGRRRQVAAFLAVVCMLQRFFDAWAPRVTEGREKRSTEGSKLHKQTLEEIVHHNQRKRSRDAGSNVSWSVGWLPAAFTTFV